MKTIIVCIAITMLSLSGCELLTREPGAVQKYGGTDLIINEVFTIRPDKYYSYSWIQLYNPTANGLRTFSRTFPATGYAVGGSGTILYTTDDGGSWTQLPDGPAGNINGINNPYPDSGFICGDGGMIMRTIRDTAGIRFVTLPSPTTTDLNAIVFVPLSKSGYVVGKNGTIYRTITRGEAWDPQTSPTVQNLNAVCCVDVKTAYACGDSGVILKSPKPNKWEDHSPGEAYRNDNFHGMYFTADTGWVVGDDGKIMLTTNGGAQWVPETSGVHLNLYGVWFLTSRQGIVVGDSGVVLTTYDGGRTKWRRILSSATSATLRSLCFVDSLRGWAFGDQGTIVQTTNAGRAWQSQHSGGADLRTAVFLPLLVEVDNYYLLKLRVRRNKLYYDPSLMIDLMNGTNPNMDVVTARDTAVTAFVLGTGIGVDTGLVRYLLNQGTFSGGVRIAPGGFGIIISDSAKFQDHTGMGPGQTNILNVFFIAGLDTGRFTRQTAFYKWDLLPTSELRLSKVHIKQTRLYPPKFLGYTETILDVVRFGKYPPQGYTDYPGNLPQDFIPEGWALARYNNDLGVDPAVESTVQSFYLTEKPIPGWYTQRRR